MRRQPYPLLPPWWVVIITIAVVWAFVWYGGGYSGEMKIGPN